MVSADFVISQINKYLAKHAFSRAAFATQTGIAVSTLDKVLSGHAQPSAKFLLKVSETTDICLEPDSPEPLVLDLPRHPRAELLHLEGSYQTVRPSYRDPSQIQGFATVIAWCEQRECLCFHEEGNDLSPRNQGFVSVPVYNRMLYLLSVERGNLRLSILSDAYQPGIYYGGLLTVSSMRMVDKMPTATIFALKKLEVGEVPVLGTIGPEHPAFAPLDSLLQFARQEGFFRSLS